MTNLRHKKRRKENEKMKCKSKCPKCGNINILTEQEAEKTMHCQRCYNHYDLGLTRVFEPDFLDDSF
jgi:transcription elongation factor Elf1